MKPAPKLTMTRFVPLFALAALAALCAGHARAVPVEITVLGPDGAPVAGASVLEYRQETPVVTDKDGRAAVEAKEEAPAEGVIGGVAVFAPGRAVAMLVLKRGGDTTVRLEPAAPLRGVVRDGAGRPVAHVPLSVVYLEQPTPFGSRTIPIPAPLQKKLSARTAADGSFSLDGAMAGATASVEIDDPRFVREVVPVPAGETGKTLVVRAAGVIAGRLRYEDGRPAAGLGIWAMGLEGSGSHSQAVTGADGAYRLEGLTTGKVGIFTGGSGEWVAAAIDGLAVVEGTTVDAPDMTLRKGGFIEGVVTDAETGKPVAGATVLYKGPQFPASAKMTSQVQADAAGKYRVPVVPGLNFVAVSAPAGYARDEKMVEVTVGPQETKTLPFRLGRGLTLAGTAVDEVGKPVAGVNLNFVYEYRGRDVVTGATGEWSLSGLSPGKYDIQLLTAGWDLVSPWTLTLPSAAPPVVTLRRAVLAVVSGRVVTTTGEPVAGASVQAESGTRTTDAQGRFTLENVRADVPVRIAVVKEGYRHVSGGVATKKGATMTLSDAVLLPLPERIAGRLLDAAGKPVRAAHVLSPDGDPDVSAVTDADGRFTLASLPRGEVHLIAAGKDGFADARLRTGTGPVTLALMPHVPASPGPDRPRALALLEDLAASSRTPGYTRNSLAAAVAGGDLERARKMAADREGKITDGGRVEILLALADADPARAAQWGAGQLALISEGMRERAATELGIKIALVRPDVAAALYRQAALKTPTAQSGGAPFHYLALYSLATRVHSPDAEKWGDRTVELARTNGNNSMGSLKDLIPRIAEFDPARAERLAGELPPKERYAALAFAIQRVSRTSPAMAQGMLARLDSLTVPTMAGDEGPEPGFYRGIAAVALVEALGKQDPAGALSIARTITYPNQRPLALAQAASYLPPAQAAPVFREAAQTSPGNYVSTATLSRIAAMAWEKDPALGRELYARVREAMDREPAERRDVADYAFYSARMDPGEARLLLEAEFARLRAISDDESQWEARNALARIAPAMCAVDIDRALEMAREIPGGERIDVQRRIVNFLLATPQERRNLPFGRWTMGDWKPSDPIGR